METLIIENNSTQAQNFINFAQTLPFVKIISTSAELPKKSLQQAVAESSATTVDVFFDELENRIKKHPRNV